MAVRYPFLFINHGPIFSEAIGKNEELWMWFVRDVTPMEKRKITRHVPPPLSWFMAWDRRFAYFGSNGDVYDYEVVQTYGASDDEQLRDDWDEEEFCALLEAATQPFAAAVEAWAKEVHAIVPLVAFYGPPGGGGGDPWHRHSMGRLKRTLVPLLVDYQARPRARHYLECIKKSVDDCLRRHAAR